MRLLTEAIKAQMGAHTCKIGFLASLAFEGQVLHYTTRNTDIFVGEIRYTGNGLLLPFTAIRENNDLSAEGIEATFMNAGSDLISAVLTRMNKSLISRFYIAFWDANDALIADPYEFFAGYMDIPTIMDSFEGTTLRVTFETKLLRLTRTREWRYSTATQNILHPGIVDVGFSSIDAVAQWDGFWGKKKKPEKEKNRDKVKKGRK